MSEDNLITTKECGWVAVAVKTDIDILLERIEKLEDEVTRLRAAIDQINKGKT